MQKGKKKKKNSAHKSQEIKTTALHHDFVNINLQIFCKKQGNYYPKERLRTALSDHFKKIIKKITTAVLSK